MTGEQLKQIRDAAAKHPRAFNEKGAPLLRPSVFLLVGQVAIGHRSQLIEYTDQLLDSNLRLRDKLLECAKECSECGGAGVVKDFGDHGTMGREVECPDCLDIREVLK